MIVRFGMFEYKIVLGLIGFGESPLSYVPRQPGENAGMSPAVSLLGAGPETPLRGPRHCGYRLRGQ